MKTYFCIIAILLNVNELTAQEKRVDLKELGVPNSPAFVIADISPTVVQTPTTPKEFILGVGQAFQQSESGFPQNYSLEFTPYWWFNPPNRSIYSFLGFKTDNKGAITSSFNKQNPFYSLKFINFSLAFLSKDLIPDSSDQDQKIFSIGFRTTLIKINRPKNNLVTKLQQWHDEAVEELKERARIELEPDGPKKDSLLEEYDKKDLQSNHTQEEIIDLINEKPIFSFDVAGAYATYGIGDSVWKSGRFGVWTTLSSYVPLAISTKEGNYLSVNMFLRFMSDKFTLSKENKLIKTTILDFGGKGGFEFDKLSFGVEALYRFKNKKADSQNRTIGYISYQVGENLYINGAFGKNFGPKDKLVSLIGINWGIGNERISFPEPPPQ